MTQEIDTVQLVTKLRTLVDGLGIHPAAVDGVERDGYGDGWNACCRELIRSFDAAIFDATHKMWDDPQRLFSAFDSYFIRMDDKWHVFLNDTWYYACADCEEIPPEEYEVVAKWAKRFGAAGLYYWCFLKRGDLPQIPQTRRLVEAIQTLETPASPPR